MKVNNSVIVLATKPRMVAETQHPEHPELVGSALKSGPVSVLLPFLEGPRTGPVPESFRIQEPRTRTAKNRKKPVVTGRNRSRNEYNKTRAISAKLGHVL